MRWFMAAALLVWSVSGLSVPAWAVPSTEARLAALENKEEIRDLIDTYNLLHNLEDWNGLSHLFAKNGTLRAYKRVARGPAEIEALVHEKMGQTPFDPMKVKGILFNTDALIVQTDADHAKVTSRWVYFVPNADNKPVPFRIGRYMLQLVREDGRWKYLDLYDPTDIPTGIPPDPPGH